MKLTIKEVQKIEDRALKIGHKAIVEHDGKEYTTVLIDEVLYGDDAASYSIFGEGVSRNTDWTVNERATSYEFNTLVELEQAGWIERVERRFKHIVWYDAAEFFGIDDDDLPGFGW